MSDHIQWFRLHVILPDKKQQQTIKTNKQVIYVEKYFEYDCIKHKLFLPKMIIKDLQKSIFQL